MVSIARKNLFHDRGRFAITVIGIAASLMLIFFGLGMAVGTVDTMVSIVDHANADIWVVQEGNKEMLNPSVIRGNVTEDIHKITGVKGIYKLIYSQSKIEKGGTQLNGMIVGFNLNESTGLPWGLVSGDVSALYRNNTIIIDKSAQQELGELSIGDHVEIGDIPQEIVGMTENVKSFIYPMVFTTHKNAQKLCGLQSNETNFILLEIEPNHDKKHISDEVSKIGGIDAFSTDEIRKNSIDWMFYKSGMGVGTLTFAAVGLFVAIIIISLTIYTATMERLPEFGTLKAIGASKKDIYGILVEQVFWSVTIGYVAGLILSILGIIALTSVMLMPIKVTLDLAVIAYLLTLLLSVLGSITSIRKVNKIDPAIVFRA